MSTSRIALSPAIRTEVKSDLLPPNGVARKTALFHSFGKSKSSPVLSSVAKAHSDFKSVPLPSQIAFNDAQTTHWLTHTSPHVSRKEKKLVDLRKIAYVQEKAGLHFEGKRSLADAEVELLQERLVQSSQAARIINPLILLADVIKNLKHGISYYLQSTPSIANLVDQFSEPVGSIKFKVTKSTALSEREAAGQTISTFGIGLVDRGHYSIQVQNGVKVFLEKNFNPERGDIFFS